MDLAGWTSIPELVENAVRTGDLDAPADALRDAMTLRELVHHVAEANLVAAGIVVAACGSPGSTFDWSWMMPFGPWMTRMDYAHKPIEPSLAVIRAVNAWVAMVAAGASDRVVLLRDQPGGPTREATVADVLAAEVQHAREHFGVADAGRQTPDPR